MCPRLFLTLLFAAMLATPASSQTTPFPLVLSGMTAPSGGTYQNFSRPVIDDAGRVSFISTLTGGAAASGIFTVDGTAGTIALAGDAAPGGGTINIFADFRLTSSGPGQLLFQANTTGGSSTGGFFIASQAGTEVAFLRGDAAPGVGGGTIGSTPGPVINDSGQVAFSATVEISSSVLGRGIFRTTGGVTEAVARTGDAAPGGGIFGEMSVPPTLNNAGLIAFHADTDGPGSSGIFVGVPGAVTQVARRLDLAPGSSGATFANFSGPSVNDAGQVAFASNLLTNGITSRPNAGIFTGNPGNLHAVALQGTASPTGAAYTFFPESPIINSTGRVTFTAGLSDAQHDAGIFTGAAGAVQTVALRNAAAPGGGFFTNILSIASTNVAGQVAFISPLSGAGFNPSIDVGLYVWSDGNLVKIVSSGDVIDVDPTAGVDLRTVLSIGVENGFNNVGLGGEDGRGISFNDNGQLTYRLGFTDGSQGILTSHVVPVPEPSCMLMLACVGLASRSLRRRVASLA